MELIFNFIKLKTQLPLIHFYFHALMLLFHNPLTAFQLHGLYYCDHKLPLAKYFN